LRHYKQNVGNLILIKLAVFDFDSTLMDGETIDFFAEALGIGEQVSANHRAGDERGNSIFSSLCNSVWGF